MIPQFTAEMALTTSGTYRTRDAVRVEAAGTILPQQRRQTIDPFGGPLETGAINPCPGCFTHTCGFLGLSTCLTCC